MVPLSPDPLLDPVAQPGDERPGLFGEAQPQQGVHGEGGVTDPGEAVVPVAFAAQLLRESRGRGGHQGAARCEGHELERDRGTLHHLAPAPGVAGLRQPRAPERHGLVEEPLVRVQADLGRWPLGAHLQHQSALLTGLQRHRQAQGAVLVRENVEESLVLRFTDGVHGEFGAVLRGEDRSVPGDLRLVLRASVVEPRGDLHLERHAAAHTADQTHQTVAGSDRRTRHRHEVDHLAGARLRHEPCHQDRRTGQVQLLGRMGRMHRPDRAVTALLLVQQRPEDTGRVEPRGAEPVDRALGGHQRRGLQIADETVVLDQWIAVHHSAPFGCQRCSSSSVVLRFRSAISSQKACNSLTGTLTHGAVCRLTAAGASGSGCAGAPVAAGRTAPPPPPARFRPWGIGAQTELARGRAGGAGFALVGPADTAFGVEQAAVVGETVRETGLVRELQTFLDVVRAPVALGEVEQDHHVGEKALRPRVQAAPADGRGDPQVVLAVAVRIGRGGTDAVADFVLVDPDEPLGVSRLQGQGHQIAGFGDERVEDLFAVVLVRGADVGRGLLVCAARHREPSGDRLYGLHEAIGCRVVVLREAGGR